MVGVGRKKTENGTGQPEGLARVPNLALPKRDAALRAALEAVRKKCGHEAVMRMSEELAEHKHAVLPSGSLQFDWALGGGWPFSRVVELFGENGAGKSTMALQAMASCQQYGGIAAYIDAEHAWDPIYAGRIGVVVPDTLVSQPDSGEQGLQIVETLVETGNVNLIVVDSVAALVPQAEIDGEIGDAHIGLQARLMSQALRKITPKLGKSCTCMIIFINQLRDKIGGYGEMKTTPGGNALKFYASVRVDVRPGPKIKRGEEIIGHNISLRVVKNKLAPPFQKVEADLIYGKGLWRAAEILDLAVLHGVVEKSGAWYAHGEERLGQGREHAAEWLEEQPERLVAIEKTVRERMQLT